MATTSSFSRGCFIFKGNATGSSRSPRKRARKSTKKGRDLPIDSNNGLLFSQNDKSSATVRMETYKQTWNFIKKTSEKTISESHKQLLQDIQSFVNNNRDLTQSSIPTALVALGVNLPDHASFFKLLDSTLKATVTPFVAMLSSKECPSLKHMVQKTIQKLTNDESIDEVEGDTEEEIDEEIVQKKPSVSKKLKNLTNLAQWYSQVVIKSPLIIIIQDLESFSSQLLQDFVLLCREYRVRNELPIQFIMGLATTAVLQQQLHHRTSVCLATKSFQSEPSVVLLNHLIEKLFMRESVLKIGPRLMQQLLDGFLYHDLSLSSFMQRIHLIIMQHYIVVPVSTLTCPTKELKSRVKQLNTEDLDLYRQLPSFMRYVESDRSKVSLLADDKAFRQFLVNALEELDTYSKEFALHCRLVHSLSEGLPDAPFGKTLRECYINLLADSGNDDWNKFIRLFNLSSAFELRTRLESALKNLKEFSDAATNSTTSIVLFLEQLRRLEEESLNEGSATYSKSEAFFNPQGKKLDKYELKAQLLATAKQAKPVSKFDEIKGEILNWLGNDVATRIKSPSSQVFHEIFYAGSQMQPNWDIVPWIRRQIQPVPRVAITKALANPAAYLGCSCCSLNTREATILPTMPDLCIAYKLHNECGRLINLYDWMVSFNSIHKKDEDDEGEEIEPIIQARFIRSVAQLQLLGFIQSSKRKTDHVARLTWGV